MSLDIGSPAPAFTLETPDGPVSLSDFAGQKLVLYFYPQDDTSGCTAEAIAFSGLADDFRNAGTTVIGVSKDSVASHRKFATKHNLTVKLGADPEGTTVEAYGAWVEKSMYGKKYMGIERTTVLIDAAGKVARVWPKVKVPDHAAEVLEAAKAL